jgi:ABC-type glycerol-3-phosphate transport system substrate-binding protein
VVIMIHSSMRKAITIIALAAGLAGCGAADLISNGLRYTAAVETDLEQATGIKPQVGFNWSNGGFKSVTVTFPRLYAGKPLGELADAVREVVAKEFKQKPDTIVLAFALEK